MTTWDYRVIKKVCPRTQESTYQIHEIYYNDDGSIDCWSDTPVQPLGVSEPGLRNDIHSFLRAFRLPILEEHLINGKPRLLSERLSKSSDALQADYASKATRASSYLYQILGNHLLLKQEPDLRQAYDRVDKALADLYSMVDSKRSVMEG